MSRTGLTKEQELILLRDLKRERVSTRKGGHGKALSYVEAWDIKRTLIRVFGFGGFSAEVTDNVFRWETMTIKTVTEKRDGKEVEVEREIWEVAYQATVRLSVPSLDCVYSESAVGSAIGSRAEAHDNAIKNAASDALKRAAIYLGTQFGLSLYNNGAIEDVVQRTLVGPISQSAQDQTDRLLYWRKEIHDAPDREELARLWTRVLDEGLGDIPYEGSRTLLEDVNECIAYFKES